MDRGRLLSDTTDYSNRLTEGEALLENQAKKKMLQGGRVGRDTRQEKSYAVPLTTWPGVPV